MVVQPHITVEDILAVRATLEDFLIFCHKVLLNEMALSLDAFVEDMEAGRALVMTTVLVLL